MKSMFGVGINVVWLDITAHIRCTNNNIKSYLAAKSCATFETLVILLIPMHCNDMSSCIAWLFELHLAD